MKTRSEHGIALILALILMTALSLLGVSLMFLSRTETLASANYRLMTQSRYAAESAVQKAANFLLDSNFYPLPGGGGDPITAYDMTKSPVQCSPLATGCTVGKPIVLSANSTVPSNYPIPAVITNFGKAFQSPLSAGSLGASYGTGKLSLSYNAVATLLTMQHFDSFDGLPTTIQTWQIVGDGGVANSDAGRSTNALDKTVVEVQAVVETPKIPGFNYAAFATDPGCGAMSFGGTGTTKSYDSGTVTGTTVPTKDNYDGDVGTNGNLDVKGNVNIYGNLYSPRAGVGACTVGNVVALSETGGASVWGDDNNKNTPIQLPKAITYPNTATPTLSLLPAVSFNSVSGVCASLGVTPPATCVENTGAKTVTIDAKGTTVSLPQISIGSQANLVLVAAGPGKAARYDINSLWLGGQATIGIQATDSTQHVMVNLVGEDNTGAVVTPALDLQGGGFVAPTGTCTNCSVFDATMLQFIYNGTSEIKFRGNTGASASFYAPNAQATLAGNTALYGSIIAKTVSDQGGADIFYDRRLQKDFWIAGQPMLGTFTWRRF